MILILVYQAIPMGYLYLLYKERSKLSPDGDFTEEERLRIRDADKRLLPIEFLFKDLRCGAWYHEVVDMYATRCAIGFLFLPLPFSSLPARYRRVVFISMLPLIGKESSMRIYAGAALAFLSTIYFREALPYRVPFTSLLGTLAQYQVDV